MITITIGTHGPTDINDVDDAWVRERVRELSSRNLPVCVRIGINLPGINIVLTTSDCHDPEPVSSRAVKPVEARLFELWRNRGLKDTPVSADDLNAFIRTELRHLGH